MSGPQQHQVAIVDYGMGNLFSVKQACEWAGLTANTTASPKELLAADAVILPGVGAFEDAMATLKRLGLVRSLLEFVSLGKPLVGICLGMQLLMTEGYEFGYHEGLGIIEGQVERLEESAGETRKQKVPQVGWNRIQAAGHKEQRGENHPEPTLWQGTLLEGIDDGEFMYFVHSFYPRPNNSNVVLSTTQYGHVRFCSSLRLGNVFAFQFHPERSGARGLQIYRNLASLIETNIRSRGIEHAQTSSG